MFLFNSFHRSGLPVAARRGAFALCVFFCLFAALLLIGCKTGDDDFVDDQQLNSRLLGSWQDGSWSDEGDYDDYTVTGTDVTYSYGGVGYEMMSYAGTIEYVSNFSKDAGVIIIKYYPGSEASYYDDDYNLLPLKGDYLGIYYRNLKPGVSVQIGGAYVADGAEESTLEAAKAAFTKGNMGTYMGYWGTYLYTE
ncbi:MAG: hypothetical protein FWH38_00045 [Treponema sp.]|nr:hypothetical protein [Treponema sp.]